MKYIVAPLILVSLIACGQTDQKPKSASPASSGGANGGVIPANPNNPSTQAVDLLSGTPSGSGNANAVGTVQSVGLSPAAAFFDTLGTQDANGQNPVFMAVVVSTRGDTCTTLLAGKATANVANLVLLLNPQLDSKKPAATSVVQTYPVIDPNAAQATTPTGAVVAFQKADGSCQPTVVAAAGAGTVAVQSASYTGTPAAQGTFDVQFGTSGDALKGGFTAAPCPGMAALLATQIAGAAQPAQTTCVP